MKNKRDIQRRTMIYIVCTIIAVLLIIEVFARILVEKKIDDIVDARAIGEVQGATLEQTELVEQELEDYYGAILFFADYLQNSHDFTSRSSTDISKLFVGTGRFEYIGYADKNGDAISYKGESMGNYLSSSNFSAIISGAADRIIDVIVDDDGIVHLMFLTPVFRDGAIDGVLFAMKDAAPLDRVLMTNEDDNDCIFIILPDGQCVSGNDAANKLFDAEPGFTQELLEANASGRPFKESILEDGRGDFVLERENTLIVSYSSLDINNWTLIVMADKDVKEAKFEGELHFIRNMVSTIIAVLAVLLFVVFIVWELLSLRLRKANRSYEFERKRNEILIENLNCIFCEYDVKTRIVKTSGADGVEEPLKLETDIDKLFEQLKKHNPECDFDGIMHLVETAVKTGEKQETTIVVYNNNIPAWYKLTFIPYKTKENKVTHVFGSAMNVTEDHKRNEQNSQMLEKTPGGFHRCYLSAPVHVEYVSDGMCRMLGYTREELAEVMKDGKYLLAICEEDRPAFIEYVKNRCKEPGVSSCEYRMVCKDGSLRVVSDTMESVLSSEGIMYGYSSVYDITGQAERIAELEDELAESRYKNSISQMQPHFLYNALASIREIILFDPEYASDLIVDFTTHLRACIRAMSSNNLVSFKKEIENIKAYVNIEKMRFGDKLKVEYDIGCDDFEIVPLSIQPLVENAIRHGIYERGAAGGTVSIRSRKADDGYLIKITDDGIGFDYEKIKEEVASGKRDSTGLESLIFRLEKMQGAEVTIESHEGEGTTISVKLPTNYQHRGGAALNAFDNYSLPGCYRR